MTGLSVRGVEIASQPYDQSLFDRNRPAVEEQPPELQSDEHLLPNRHPLPADYSIVSVLARGTKSLRERVFGKKKEVWSMVPALKEVSLSARLAATGGSTTKPAGVQLPSHAPFPPRKQNVLAIGHSNFASVTQDYDELKSTVLVFANNSLRLGLENKKTLGALAEQFDAQSDLFSLMGCSHGPSSRANGNEHLAISRANRVKEALILANVSAESILDEGCWAPMAQEGLPARGVIVRMLRRTVDS